MRKTPEEFLFSSRNASSITGEAKEVKEIKFSDFVDHIKNQAQVELMGRFGFTFESEPEGLTDEELKPVRARNNAIMAEWVTQGKAQAFETVFRFFADSKRGHEILQTGNQNKILNILEKFFGNPRYNLSLWTDEALEKDLESAEDEGSEEDAFAA